MHDPHLVDKVEREGIRWQCCHISRPHSFIHSLHTIHPNSRQTAEINRYVKGEVDWLDIAEYKKWTAFGVLLLVLGLVSTAFAVLCGDFSGLSIDKKARKSRWAEAVLWRSLGRLHQRDRKEGRRERSLVSRCTSPSSKCASSIIIYNHGAMYNIHLSHRSSATERKGLHQIEKEIDRE